MLESAVFHGDESAVKKVRLFLSDLGLAESEPYREPLLVYCAAPVPAAVRPCADIGRNLRLDYAAMLLQSQSALTYVLRACSAPYRDKRILKWPPAGEEDCGLMGEFDGLMFKEFQSGIRYLESGDIKRYKATFQYLDRSLKVDSRFDAYRSAVIFHLARAHGFLCEADAEDRLKRALEFERRIEAESDEIYKRTYELGYFYFDRREIAKAIDFIEQSINNNYHHGWIGGLSLAQANKDLSDLYSMNGNGEASAYYRKEFNRLQDLVSKRAESFAFDRRQYPSSCH